MKLKVIMQDVRIRKSTKMDIDEIYRLETQWAEEDITYGYNPDTVEDITAKLGDYFLIADIGGSITGFIYGSVGTSQGLSVIPAGQQYLEIDAIYVIPEYRNQGIGSLLLDSLVDAAKQQGIRRFNVFSATKDFDNIYHFYRSHGFQPWGIQLFK